MSDLVKYDAMCQAIDAAYEVDEVKAIRDKAVAMEAYFQQAKNVEAERRACEIRLRAERKAGELLSKTDMSKGAADTRSPQVTTLKERGITKNQSSRWQAVANVPENDFEAALAAEKKPSTSGIIVKPRQMPETSLWLWGRLRDFERTGLLQMTAEDATALMTEGMLTDVRRLAPIVAAWLKEISDDIG